MIAGSLEIQMMADLAKLKKDMDDARSYVSNAASAMGKALGAIGAGLSIAGIAAWIKAGIDAADAAHQIAQKTGLATKDVAGLQLAFKLGVGSADGMTGALAKMSKSIVDGSGAYKLLGVNVKNADGTFRSTKDVLYDTADAFAGIKDGAGKTALAMEIFGKSGAELIPMLNGGADGLREMADMAEKLGLVVDEKVGAQADRFNDTLDLLQMSTKGMAIQIAGQLLPTLNNVVGGFLNAMTSGDALKRTADFLASGLKVLYTVIAGGIQVVATLGQGFGALGATIAAVLSGNFGEAKSIIADFLDVSKRDWTAAISNIGSVWEGTAAKTAEEGAKIVRAQRDVTQASKDAEAAAKAAAAAKEKEAEAYLAFKGKIADLILKQQEEIDSGEKLTASDKLLLEAKKKLTGAELATAEAMIAVAAEQEKVLDLRRREAVANAEAAKARTDALKAIDTETAKLLEQIEQQRAHNDSLATGVDRTDELAIARLRDAAAAAERQAIVALDKNLDEETYNAYMRQAQALRDLADARETGIGLEAAKKASDEWMKVSDQIGQGLTDSLFRAFESGGGFFSTLWQGIKNTFKTTVLRLTVDAVMNPVKMALGSVFNGVMGAGGAGGSILSSLGSFGSMLGEGIGSLGSLLGFGGTGIVAGMGGIGAASVGGTIMTPAAMEAMIGTAGYGTSAAAGAAAGGGGLLGTLGAVAPYLAAAALIASAFKHTPTHHEGSVVFADAAGARTDASRDFLGVLGHQNKGTDAALRTMGGGIVGLLNTLSQTFGGAGGYAAHLQFAADNDDASFGIFDLLRNGARIGGTAKTIGGNRMDYASNPEQGFAEFGADVGRAVRSAIDTIDLPQWARDALAALGTDPSLDALTQAATAIAQTRQQLTGLGEALTPMGGIFARIAALGDEAKLSLAGMVGGIDQLVAKSQSFVQAYYSEGEQAGIAARQILEQVQRAGMSPAVFDLISGLGSKGEFRALFEGIDISNDMGRRMAALGLNIAQPFAQIAEYLAANELTLGGLAASGVDPAVLQLLNSATEAAAGDAADVAAEAATTTAEAATETATATKATAEAMAHATDKLAEVVSNTAATVVAVSEGLRDVAALLAEIRDRSAAMLAEQQLLSLAGTDRPGGGGG